MKLHPCLKASCPSGINSHWLVRSFRATKPNCGNILPKWTASLTTSYGKPCEGTRGNDLGSKNGDVRDNPQPRLLSLERDKEQGSETTWFWSIGYDGLRYSPASWRQDRQYRLFKASTYPILGWLSLFQLNPKIYSNVFNLLQTCTFSGQICRSRTNFYGNWYKENQTTCFIEAEWTYSRHFQIMMRLDRQLSACR